jgi:hypothetical protein
VYRSLALELAPYPPALLSAALNRLLRQFGPGRIAGPPWQRALHPFLRCGFFQFSRSSKILTLSPFELRILADYLYPPIQGGKVVTEFGGGRHRVTRKSGPRDSFRIHVGK